VASPFLVPVAQLVRDEPAQVVIKFSAPFDAAHEFEPRAFGESDVPVDADVDVDLRLQSFRGGVRAAGTLRAPWRGICRRCSVVICDELDVLISERYVEDPAPHDEEAYALSGDFVDLLPLVHDAVLLELPIAPLCRVDCLGLCPSCGTDRNEASCSCQLEPDPRWATLDALRLEDDSSD
jgi:uncharacterized protein